jgi:hypothetical protein
MSAWTIYWVMQLDSIGSYTTFLTLAIGAALVLLTIFGAMNRHLSNTFPELDVSKQERSSGEMMHRIARRLIAPFLIISAVATFIPSSRTAAAVVILPAITNNEQIKKEAGDLYGLAKQALTNLAKPEESSK